MPVNESLKQTTEKPGLVLCTVSAVSGKPGLSCCVLSIRIFFETFIIMPALAGSPVRDDRIPGSSLELFRRAHIPGKLLCYIPAEEILQCTTWPEFGRFPQHCQSCQLDVRFAASEMTCRDLYLPAILVPQWPGFRVSPCCHAARELRPTPRRGG